MAICRIIEKVHTSDVDEHELSSNYEIEYVNHPRMQATTAGCIRGHCGYVPCLRMRRESHADWIAIANLPLTVLTIHNINIS